MRIDASLISRFSQAAHIADNAAGEVPARRAGLLSGIAHAQPASLCQEGVALGAPAGADRREEGWQTFGPA
jgi:hypothetical protein